MHNFRFKYVSSDAIHNEEAYLETTFLAVAVQSNAEA